MALSLDLRYYMVSCILGSVLVQIVDYVFFLMYYNTTPPVDASTLRHH